MLRLAFCLLAFLVSFLWAEEKPDLLALADPEFPKREAAQAKVRLWATKFPKLAKEELLKLYLRSEEPELRVRLIALMERAYFPPKGYVGVVMRADFLDRFGRIPRMPQGEPFIGYGVRIISVAPGTPAEKSGLKVGDVILKINDWEVKGADKITSAVAEQIQKHPPSTPVSIQIRRGEDLIDLKLELGILPVPSERARSLMATDDTGNGVLPVDLAQQLVEFRVWLAEEIEKDQKNLIADRPK